MNEFWSTFAMANPMCFTTIIACVVMGIVIGFMILLKFAQKYNAISIFEKRFEKQPDWISKCGINDN